MIEIYVCVCPEWYTSFDVYTLQVYSYVLVSFNDTISDTVLGKNTLADITFGEWLKRQRKAGGLTQEQLAGQLNCSTITLRKIESEERRPSVQITQQLAEIFNVPPNEQTSFLRFARGDWRSAPGESAREVPWRASTVSPRSNVPSSLTALIGREQELASLSEYLSNPNVRLITMIGPPGTGKTSLSLQVAREAFPDFAYGVFFVALAPLEDPSLVATTVVQTLGFVETPDRSPFEQLKDGIGERQMLIVLDNLEHLIEGTAILATDLLSACPRLKILATSREALHVPGEWLYIVSPLSIPEESSSIDVETISQFSALTLFAERARAVRPDFALDDDNIQTVATICVHLDGLPLAIELVAARIRLMSPASLLSHLNDRFVLSADGMRSVSPRQRTLYSAIDWSYNLLTDKEQVLFRRLAVFSGGWTLEAMRAICSGEGIEAHAVPDLLMHLVDKSLVTVRAQESEERYQALVIIRQYAQEKLVESQEFERVRNRHLDFFMNMAEQAEPKLHGGEQMTWLERLEREQGNFRTALKWGLGNCSEAGFRLVNALWLFWFMRAHFIEGRQWYDKALSTDEDASPLICIRLLTAAASNAMGRNDPDQTALLSEQGLSLAREQENEWGIAMSLHHLGIAATWQGDYKRAQALLEEGLGVARKMGHWAIASYLLWDLGALASVQGHYEQAIVFNEEGLSLSQEREDRWGTAYALQLLAFLAYQQNDYSHSQALSKRALLLSHEFKDKRVVSDQLQLMGMLALCHDQPERGARLISAAEALMESIGVAFVPEERDIMLTLREQLSDTKFEALRDEGRAMTMEQAVAYALEKNDD